MSDKYDWCQEGFLALKFTDRLAWAALVDYAEAVRDKQPALSSDIKSAVGKAVSQDGSLIGETMLKVIADREIRSRSPVDPPWRREDSMWPEFEALFNKWKPRT